MTLDLGISGPSVVGIDLSMNATGLGLVRKGAGYVMTLPAGNRRGHPRLEWLAAEVVKRCQGMDLVLIEALAFAARGATMFQIAGAHTLVCHELWRAGIEYTTISPSSIKRYGSGKGNCSKDQMMAAVIRRYPNVAIMDNNQADAFCLAAMGADWLGYPIAKVPADQRAAIDAIKNWPARPERVLKPA